MPEHTFHFMPAMLIFSHYDLKKEYEVKTSIENYLETQEEIIKQLVRVLSDKGNLCCGRLGISSIKER
jgi:hypothetical protein